MRPQPKPRRSGSFGRGFSSHQLRGQRSAVSSLAGPMAPRTEPWQADDLVAFGAYRQHFQSHNYAFPEAMAT